MALAFLQYKENLITVGETCIQEWAIEPGHQRVPIQFLEVYGINNAFILADKIIISTDNGILKWDLPKPPQKFDLSEMPSEYLKR
jgi:hypothetical protein